MLKHMIPLLLCFAALGCAQSRTADEDHVDERRDEMGLPPLATTSRW